MATLIVIVVIIVIIVILVIIVIIVIIIIIVIIVIIYGHSISWWMLVKLMTSNDHLNADWFSAGLMYLFHKHSPHCKVIWDAFKLNESIYRNIVWIHLFNQIHLKFWRRHYEQLLEARLKMTISGLHSAQCHSVTKVPLNCCNIINATQGNLHRGLWQGFEAHNV